MNATRTDEVFGALADPNRRRIIERLAAGGPATATALATDLGVSRQGAAKHLANLADAGIVRSAREGREVRYELVEMSLEPGVRWIAGVGARWDRSLARLKEHLEG